MPQTSYQELQCGPDPSQSAPVPIRIFVWSNQMELKICICCGKSFHPRPQVENQSYCSTPSCQRDRRRAWQHQKLQNDPFYRENQQDAQRAWRERNPNCSRHYRATNSEYTDRIQWLLLASPPQITVQLEPRIRGARGRQTNIYALSVVRPISAIEK